MATSDKKNSLACVILAAGQGTRMKSARPKVLLELAGTPMVDHGIDLAVSLGASRIVVVAGHGIEQVEAHLRSKYAGLSGLAVALQEPQLGTGHAVVCALAKLRGHRGDVLVLYGDVPLLERATVRRLLSARRRRKAALAMLTMQLEDAGAYGRVVRGRRSVVEAVVEAADASDDILAIREANAGIYCFDLDFLRKASRRLGRDNAQGEFYLTDTVALAARSGSGVVAVPCDGRGPRGQRSFRFGRGGAGAQ